MSITQNLKQILSSLPNNVKLCAVSKYHPEEELREAYDAGQRIFGESHVQELVRKQAALPKDIEWHFIGHLQTNKVKYIAPFVSLIHSVDSPRLFSEINKQGIRCGRRIPVLIQLHMAQEETKYGFTIPECRQFLQQLRQEQQENPASTALQGIEIRGLMTMATNTDDEEQWRKEFRQTRAFFEELCDKAAENGAETLPFSGVSCPSPTLSMGMSQDYQTAIQEGSTLVRIGTAIFGERNYN